MCHLQACEMQHMNWTEMLYRELPGETISFTLWVLMPSFKEQAEALQVRQSHLDLNLTLEKLIKNVCKCTFELASVTTAGF